VEFGQATLENWPSEFLQLFAFVVLAAVFVHHGSAESRDSEDRMEQKIDRIVKKVDA
jgi:SNF2 family DNA or RNA helicase